MKPFTYERARSPGEAAASAARISGAKFIAGGTNLLDLMKLQIETPTHLIDVNGLDLDKIETMPDGGLRIGALVRNTDLAAHERVRRDYGLLSRALLAGATGQLRNMATTAGNLLQRTRCPYFYDTNMPCNKRQPGSGCSALKGYNRMHAIFGASDQCIAVHPSDMCVALAALDARVVISNSKSERKIPFTEFHRLPGTTPQKDNNLQKGELITAIEISDNEGLSKNTAYTKIRDRASYAFALVSVAAALDIKGNTIQNARLAMGGVAHKPWRLLAAENYLKGKNPSIANFQQAANLAMEQAKGYGYNNFKLKLAPNTIVQTLKTVSGLS